MFKLREKGGSRKIDLVRKVSTKPENHFANEIYSKIY